jgi:hypothetical protein
MILFEVVQMLLRFANNNTTNNNGGNLRDMWDKLNSKGNLKMAKEKDLVDLYRNLKMARENDLVDLQGIDDAMAAMASRLEGGSGGLGCIYSWVSTYKMQRATTTGLPLPAPFLTPAMEEAARSVISRHLVASRQLACHNALGGIGKNVRRVGQKSSGRTQLHRARDGDLREQSTQGGLIN